MILVIAAGLLIVCGAWVFVYRRYWEKGIRILVSFSNEMVCAGDTAKLTEVIENRKNLPIPVLEVRFSLKKGLLIRDAENASVSDHIYKRDIFSILGMQKITREIQFVCEKRGLYEIDHVEIIASSLFYLEQYTKEIPVNAVFYVCPRRTEVRDILAVSMHMLGEQQAERNICEDFFAFRGIREYTPLDSMKTINWKASAKTGDLMVNTYDSSLRGKFMIYLDVEESRIIGQETLVEEGISVAASLSEKLLAAGMEVGLAVNDRNGEQDVLLPTGGRIQSAKIQRRLAVYHAKDGNCSFASILNPQKKPRDCIFLFITKEEKEQEAIENFLNREAYGIWIYLTTEASSSVRRTCKKNLKLCVREVRE